MSEAISGLQPAALWRHFAAISAIPRASKNEAAVLGYVSEFAKQHGCALKRDSFGNLLIRKPATPGYEAAPMVCLQGHLDMVCEKNQGTVHDFAKDPLRLRRDGAFIKATGTTLGADNGVAVASGLAVIEDSAAVHGPLEILLTVEEEIGLTGAKNLDPDLVESRILLNLDSEEEGSLYVGCSGGRDTVARWPLSWQSSPKGQIMVRLRVSGLRGGHSGLDIDKQRGNALKIAARAALLFLARGATLGEFKGGSKSNAIPREAELSLYVPKAVWEESGPLIEKFQAAVQVELKNSDPEHRIQFEVSDEQASKVWAAAISERVLRSIAALPQGVVRMSLEIPGLVQSSSNIGVLSSSKDELVLITSQRSSIASEMADIAHSVGSCLLLAGAKVDSSKGYPGWTPNMASPLLALVRSSFRTLYGHEAAIKGIHAGLECGIIGQKIPGIDMVSFGPSIVDAHSPDEGLEIATVEPFYNLLLDILRRLAEQK